MGRLVDEFGNDKRDTDNDSPLNEVHPVSLLVGDTTSGLVDMRLEESHDRGHKVPCKIDDSEEDNGAHGNLVGEQYLDVIQQARLLCRLFLCSKLSALLQLTL